MVQSYVHMVEKYWILQPCMDGLQMKVIHSFFHLKPLYPFREIKPEIVSTAGILHSHGGI